MDERVVDYFVVAGLPDDDHKLVDEDLCEGLNPNQQNIEPITDITVIFPSLGEYVPKGFSCVEQTPTGYPANLNSGSIRSPEVYLCYRRGRDKPPLVDIGVMYDGKERLLPDAEVVLSTPEGRPANVNNTSARTLLTFRRAPANMPCNELVVTDICVIFQNKGEKPPHAFCLIQKNLNKGMMGCDVYLCYKKSMNRPPLLSFKPEVLLRFPPVDRKTFPFPPLTATFCLPMCATIECWPKIAAQPRPVFSTFVLTVADATEKIYGAAITFYEEYSAVDKLTNEQKEILGYVVASDKEEKSIHVNKCICLLSHHPFFDAFRTFLYYLYWMTRNGLHDVPIERYISHLLEEVPFPSAQRPHILMQLSPTQNILLSHPQDSPLPKSGASFRSMLNNLGPDNCMMVILLVLTEQKLLIHSLRPDVLTAVAEAVSVLIFPFRWQCPFIPLCPLGLCGVLQAPVPFLIGVDSRFFDLYEPPSDVTCIDLDTNSITVSEDKRFLLNVKLLPKKPTRILKHALETIKIVSDKMAMTSRVAAKGRNDATEVMDIDFQQKRRERTIEMEIQESFLRFMTTILKGYRSCLLPITKAPTIGATDASSLFDFQGFLRSRDKTYQKFYSVMLRTQMFIRFIEERSFVSENDSSLEFFDECVDKVEADDSEIVRLLETNEGNQSERTVFVMPPEPTGLPPNETYAYSSKFNLKEGLFAGPRLKSQSIDRVLQQTEQSSPGSPVARRTKQEIKSAQKVAKKYSEKPHLWAKYLLSTCYSIWFIHLPSYVSISSSKHVSLCLAYEMLSRMTNYGLSPADEVCYRVIMQLCGLYSQPVIAVKALLKMKRCGMTPNAITYGYYNKAVLESEWPSNVSNSSQLMWNKLRNVILGVAQFRNATRHRNAGDTVDESDRISTGSAASLDSQAQGVRQYASTARGQPVTLSPQSVSNESHTNGNGKSQSDSEVTNVSSAIPTRISSSSDIGYGSMHEQKVSSDLDIAAADFASNNTSEKQAKAAKFWGKMGQSLDQWVKSGVSSLASLAADTSYYSQSGLMMGGGFAGDYGANSNLKGEYDDDEDDDDEFDDQIPKSNDVKGAKSKRRLDFGDDQDQVDEKNESQTLRLLRSVSFGNDTQIMSKLKVLKEDLISENKQKLQMQNDKDKTKPQNKIPSSSSCPGDQRRSVSVESNSSLERKINQYYEPSQDSSRDTSAEKSTSNSREATPDESHESYQDTVRPGPGTLIPIPPPKSPSIQIRSKELSREVTPSSPARTPVTQNDPLGALSEPGSPGENESGTVMSANAIRPPSSREGTPKRTCSEGHIGGMSEKTLMGPPETPKGFHRSSTLPNYGSSMGDQYSGSNLSMNSSDEKLASCTGTPGVSGLTVFSSNLKNPFGRYSPGRLSLRKAGSSLIESTIGGKKAEAFMEGFNAFKSVAAVTMKSKLEELKEVVGNNSTPGRAGPFGRYDDSRGMDETDDWEQDPASDQWASVSESYLDQLLTTDAASTRASFASVQDSPLSGSRHSLLMVEQHFKNATNVAAASSRYNLPTPISMKINMTTCSLCHSCSSLLFDEEIMAGWTAEDSNLNTRCPHCKKWEVPFLEVNVIDYRRNPMPHLQVTSAPSLESVNTNMSRRDSVISNAYTSQSQKHKHRAGITEDEQQPAPVIKSNAGPSPPEDDGQTPTQNHVDGLGASKPEPEVTQDSETKAETENVAVDLPVIDPLGVLLEELEKSEQQNTPEATNAKSENEIQSLLKEPAISVSASAANLLESGSGAIEIQVPELEGTSCDPIVVPYLSPLVLRKELENVLDHEGDACLVQSTFVDEHPIIYWNLVWFFHRSNLPSHIKGLCLQAKTVTPTKMVKKLKIEEDKDTEATDCAKKEISDTVTEDEQELEAFSVHPSWENVDQRSVLVNCYWDNIKYHEQFTSPLYMEWLKSRETLEKTDEKAENVDNNLPKLINNVLRAAQGNTLSQTCPQLLYHYHKQSNGRHYPTYRDILFLSLIAGRDSVEAYGYGLDKEYRDVYSKLRCNDDYESMDVGDTPPSDTALFCRKYFKELQLCGTK